MNDPLKKYIQDHRDEFDNLEPAPNILFKLKKELNELPKEKKGLIQIMTNYKWLVAASVLITMSISYLFLTNSSKKHYDNVQVAKNVPSPISTHPKAEIDSKVLNESIKSEPKVVVAKRKVQVQDKGINMLKAYRDLTDSTSASTRLAAILNIQNSSVMSYDIIDQLAKTLNHDSNSNVRLAALHLMSKYTQDSYVANAFMQSLSSQNDPLVQLGLIDLLSQTNNPKLDDKLYALANDPTTFAAVKDQAYLILLNQNKL